MIAPNRKARSEIGLSQPAPDRRRLDVMGRGQLIWTGGRVLSHLRINRVTVLRTEEGKKRDVGIDPAGF